MEEMKPIKEWKDYDELLNVLKCRKMCISDEARALHYLKNIGYYRLSGYWYSFKQKDEVKSNQQKRLVLLNVFESGTDFGTI
ncbi:TPA: Abi family protein, partial [Pasteurella multocida]|nr:Abi family protein [Pasteurella multocida]